jgi:hypothetical protein
MAIQAATLPKPDEDGVIDIGPRGAFKRAAAVRTSASRYATHLGDLPLTQSVTGMGTRVPRVNGARVIRHR